MIQLLVFETKEKKKKKKVGCGGRRGVVVGCWVGVRLAHFYLLCNNVHSYLSIYVYVCMLACMGKHMEYHFFISRIYPNETIQQGDLWFASANMYIN